MSNWPDGRSITSAPAVAASGGRALGLAVRNDLSGGLSFIQATQYGEWTVWRDTNAPSPVGSAPALVAMPDGSTYTVYLRGSDDRLIVRSFS